jgi:hypothetical protein
MSCSGPERFSRDPALKKKNPGPLDVGGFGIDDAAGKERTKNVNLVT